MNGDMMLASGLNLWDSQQFSSVRVIVPEGYFVIGSKRSAELHPEKNGEWKKLGLSESASSSARSWSCHISFHASLSQRACTRKQVWILRMRLENLNEPTRIKNSKTGLWQPQMHSMNNSNFMNHIWQRDAQVRVTIKWNLSFPSIRPRCSLESWLWDQAYD